MPNTNVYVNNQVENISVKVTNEVTNITVKVSFSNGGGGGGDLDSNDFVFGEIPTGLINGSNATFNSLHNFIPATLVVKSNGLTMRLGQDYTTTGNTQINLNFSPVTNENILINYIKL